MSDESPAGRGSRTDPPLLLVGTDFRCSPLELRERAAYGKEEAEDLLVRLLAQRTISEALLVSTCNRTEIYLQAIDEDAAFAAARDLTFLRRDSEFERPGRLYVRRTGEAARHLLAVASGLESMVLGEPEILGQLKQAAILAEEVGTVGPVLRRLVRAAITAGGRARQETAIGEGAVSMGYATVELARNIFSDLAACRVLLLGAGEIARSVARPLAERGAAEIVIANRSEERAAQLLEEVPVARRIHFTEYPAALRAADLVVAATGAETPIIGERELRAAMAHRRSRPLLVVDLGVPRNVDPAAGKIGNLFLHTVDSLDHLIQRNLRRRKEEVPRVEEILEAELGHFRAWYRSLEAEPLIARLQRRAESVRQAELAAARDRFPAETHEELERLTRSLVRKILHHPSTRLRQGDGSGDLPRLDLVRELFQLDDVENVENADE
jgi:glutamyl-tRNA reductase